ncbi:MAG: YceI family protein, partial [Christiangramia sp.]|nr:YceI family protein [Christiangramia sp.]
QYPEIEIQINQVEFFSEEYSKAFISVKLAGKVNNYDLPVQINKDRFKGKFTLNIRDFGLEPPQKALGLIQVDEKIEIRFDLKIRR